jgi:hypothetical protein
VHDDKSFHNAAFERRRSQLGAVNFLRLPTPASPGPDDSTFSRDYRRSRLVLRSSATSASFTSPLIALSR